MRRPTSQAALCTSKSCLLFDRHINWYKKLREYTCTNIPEGLLTLRDGLAECFQYDSSQYYAIAMYCHPLAKCKSDILHTIDIDMCYLYLCIPIQQLGNFHVSHISIVIIPYESLRILIVSEIWG